MTTDNTINCVLSETLKHRLDRIETQMEILCAEHQDLMISEDWASQGPCPEGSEYKGKGVWLYRGGEVHVIPRSPAFEYVAQAERSYRVFKDFNQAFVWLDGVNQGHPK